MESANLQDLHNEWQSAVSAYESLFRDGRMRGLSNAEINELSHAYVLRIDTAFTRLKQAEEHQAAQAAAQIPIWKTLASA